jgi:GR25 family glycosyltransferase involved in LPS biosynthesis
MKFAPIVLFVYNRPWHTQQTVEALQKNELANESELFIYADGTKQENDLKIQEVREYIKTITGFRRVTIIEREKNYGLANNIIYGATQIVNQFGRIIVLEDDIVASEGFLKYMNDALELYADEEKVGCIHAWNVFLNHTDYKESTFFLKGADCWGWATWKRAWELFNPNGKELLNFIELNKLEYEFDHKGMIPFTEMLKDQIEGRNQSWAVRWHASLFVKDKYCLYPTTAIVKNIGLDNTGVHCGYSNLKQNLIPYIKPVKQEIKESDWFFKAYRQQMIKNTKQTNWKQQLKRKLKVFIAPIIYLIYNRFKVKTF